MTFPSVRFTVRRMMAAVAVLGIVFAGIASGYYFWGGLVSGTLALAFVRTWGRADRALSRGQPTPTAALCRDFFGSLPVVLAILLGALIPYPFIILLYLIAKTVHRSYNAGLTFDDLFPLLMLCSSFCVLLGPSPKTIALVTAGRPAGEKVIGQGPLNVLVGTSRHR